MELEAKLDGDFIFFLGYVKRALVHVRDKDLQHLCEQWLLKLCGEIYDGVDKKRSRNIYLTQLLLCMENSKLSDPFLVPLNDVNILNATETFQLTGEALEKPAWLNDINVKVEPPTIDGKKGRTYLATRTLPGGQGAFAYVAVSLEEDEPKWLGGGEGVFDQHMQRKFNEEVPDYEMEKILARRKDPKEREKVITFYTVLLQNIEDELDEKVAPGKSETIDGLLVQVEEDLKDRGKFDEIGKMDPDRQRTELLLYLHDRIRKRIQKVTKREELLDEIEKTVLTKSFFDDSITDEDKLQLPAQMWEQAINKAPIKKHIELLKDKYPLSLIERFFVLLSNHKEQIAMRMQKRYENIGSQMKRELRREDEKGKRMVEEAQALCDHAGFIRDQVRIAHDKKADAERKLREKTEFEQSDHSKLYDQMRATLVLTHKSVEDEAAIGRALAAQITAINEQTELTSKANEENIRNVEEANMDIMKNIQRLTKAIAQQEKRIQDLRNVVGLKKDNSERFDIY